MLDPNALTVLCKKKRSKLKTFRIRSFTCRRGVYRKRSINLFLKFWGVKKQNEGSICVSSRRGRTVHQGFREI